MIYIKRFLFYPSTYNIFQVMFKFTLALMILVLMFISSEAGIRKIYCPKVRPSGECPVTGDKVCGHHPIIGKKTFPNACAACQDRFIRYYRTGGCFL